MAFNFLIVDLCYQKVRLQQQQQQQQATAWWQRAATPLKIFKICAI